MVGAVAFGFFLAVVGFWITGSGDGDAPIRKLALSLTGPLTQYDSSAISPDGRMVAYTRQRRLWIQDLARLEPIEIGDSEVARFPFWSPDSEFVGYVAGGILKRVPARGGATTVLSAVPGEFQGGTWGPDDTIVFGQVEFGLSQVSAQGGEPRPYPTPEGFRAGAYAFPHFLPDGQSLLFFAVERLWCSLATLRRISLPRRPSMGSLSRRPVTLSMQVD